MYVFDTKFDIILGHSWLSQIQPTPDWFEASWEIKIRNDPNNVTIIKPIPLNVLIQEKQEKMINKANVPQQVSDNEANNLDFLITAKQLDTLFKKQKVDECYWINIERINDSQNLMLMIDTPEKEKQILSDEDRTSNEWIEEFEKAYPSVFKGVIEGFSPLRESVEDMIVLDPAVRIEAKPPYKMSPLELRELKRQLDVLVKQGLFEPTSSQYGTPILFVKSPAAVKGQPPKLRTVCDFRSLNKATISQPIPVPRIDECLQQLHGA